ncbi:hypothetical protein [Solirubrobacter soli]|uniref:hypothetical protein n=1 Tax=Solirubrobacter soli TaxID=363832 RepID=UPI0004284A39|nr:hypothetical protein [Solirubrobacter soli]
MAVRHKSRRREDEHAARLEEERSADAGGRVLALQRTAGNHAVGAMLQRTVKVNKSLLKAPPPVTPAIKKALPGVDAKALTAEARNWIGDNKKGKEREFDSDLELYQAIAKTLAAAAAPRDENRWTILGQAVKKKGDVTTVKWATFSAPEAQALEAELSACTIQLSSNPDTTAAHGNSHGKLPKPGLGDGLKKFSKGEQVDKTPYFEFLVSGQSATGITRGIYDYESNLVYLTAHYDKGSFVLLSGAPAALATNWRAKVTEFKRIQKGQ